ncbi:hypothetical protein TREMEDRAFT_30156 [Tremella mesenterica DSM 1558]|uniref:uncharacterized protein n=1 Tax=Tremella mesenterica (strain ATCC 24925 / CBS 8224 / DSM 1558 / NBRC 9311 / NRRL Y-6157 / RJB 2259-6 / UBC 559-6) TaxID=578456 RepID=UPI0003F4964F|nr:uncharacterized protein TREMEDRAFT_30156 [Tremella mesenterica DSM 1558]EIW69778.1 hypothetical protein TREMEDRAFT_30156 [Tremella mesenterica DSM 1558]
MHYTLIKRWFTEMSALRNQYHYLPENIYNMDETGYNIGTTLSSQVMTVAEGDKSVKAKVVKAQKGRQEWVTAIKCVSAVGQALPPIIIFKGKAEFNLRMRPQDRDIEGWQWTTSLKGWSSNALACYWRKSQFEPMTAPADTSQRQLLILDGHGSHVKADFIGFCIEHSIDVMVLPPHSSHWTQPLDTGVFSPLKRHLMKFSDIATRYNATSIDKEKWAADVVTARELAMTKEHIATGWRKSGLHPFNPNVVY